MRVTVNFHGSLKDLHDAPLEIEASTGAEIVGAILANTPDFFKHPGAKRCVLMAGTEKLCQDRLVTRDLLDFPISGTEYHVVPVPDGEGPAMPYLINFLIALAVALVMRWLFPPKDPKLDDLGPDSFYFSGENVAIEGSVVPLVYGGPILVPSLTVSADMTIDDTTTSRTVTDYDNIVGQEQTGWTGHDGSDPEYGPVYGTKQVNDWLQSKAKITTLEVLSEGVIEGLVTAGTNPEESLYLNDSPLMINGENVYEDVDFRVVNGETYANITADVTDTLRLPDWLRGFKATSAVNVGFKVRKGAPISTTVTEDADHLGVILNFDQGLGYTEGDGDLIWRTVDIQVDISAAGGSFQPVKFYNHTDNTFNTDPVQVSGRTRSAYQRRVLIEKVAEYGAPPYVVRVTRLTNDSTHPQLANSFQFQTIQSIFDENILYPNTAMSTVSVDAETFDNQAPSRKYLVKGIKVLIPSNYNPVTRTYTGVWDGTFVRAWTSNPAWIAYDLLANKRYGAGRRVPQRTLDTVKWSLYTISQYCDEMVPSGVSDEQGDPILEPRFSCSMRITDAKDAMKVIRDVFSCFRGAAAWHAAGLTAMADLPSDPVYVYNSTNVIDGRFNYRGASTSDHTTVVLASYRDPNRNYNKVVEYVSDPAGLRRHGFVRKSAVAVGATTRGQAIRVGRHMILTGLLEDEVVTFQTKLEAMRVAPGQVIKIHDPEAAGIQAGGRVLGAPSVNSISVDRDFTIEAGKTYTLTLLDSTGTVLEDRTVTSSPGTVVGPTNDIALVFSPSLPAPPTDDSIWMLQSDDPDDAGMTTLWRVITIEEVGKQGEINYKLEAQKYAPEKYAQIETGFDADDYTLPPPSATPVPAPTDPALTPGWKTLADGTRVRILVMSFTPSTYVRLTHHRVSLTLPNGTTDTHVMGLGQSSMTIVNPAHGTYTATITAFGTSEDQLQVLQSKPVTVSAEVAAGPEGSSAHIVGLGLMGQPVGFQFNGPDAEFVWRLAGSGAQDLSDDLSPAMPAWFGGYRVEIRDGSDNLRRTESITTPQYSYTLSKNKEDGTPTRDIKISVAAEDTTGAVVGEWASMEVSNPAPAAPSVATQPAFSQIVVTLGRPIDNDYSHLEFYHSSTPGFVPGPAELYAEGDLSSVTLAGLTAGATYYLVTRAVDAFGPGPFSIEVGVTTQAINNSDLDTTPPTLGGPLTLSTLLVDAGPETHPYIKASWPAATDDGILTGYILEWWDQATPLDKRQEFVTGLEINLGPVTPGATYVARYKARDWASNDSSWSAEDTQVAAGDTTAPGPVTAAAVIAGLRKAIIEWENPDEDRYLETEIHVRTVNAAPSNNDDLVYSGRGTSCIADGLVADTWHYVYIRTKSKAGVYSTWVGGSLTVRPFKVTSANVDIYFASAAIGDAYIANLDAVKITTGELDAARIGANSITAGKLNVSTLSAISADLGNITAGTVTGALVRTAASGQRVQFDTFGIRGYNTSTTTYHLSNDGSGFLGLGNAITWDTDGNVTIPGTLVSGEIIGNLIKTAATGWRVEIGPVADGGNPVVLMSLTNGTQRNFTMREDGSLEIGTQMVGDGANQLYRNLIDPSVWELGEVTQDPGAFDAQGGGSVSTNEIVMTEGPNGEQIKAWKITTGTTYPRNGGYNSDLRKVLINPNQAYRFSMAFKREGFLEGRTYLGCGISGVLRVADDTPHGNPYLFHGAPEAGCTWMQEGKWYLAVATIQAAGWSGTTVPDADSGVYDMETGERVSSPSVLNGGYYDILKWNPAATETYMRSYNYYASQAGAIQYMAQPRIEARDGSEPTVAELMGAARNWNQLGSRPVNFRLVSRGSASTSHPIESGLYDEDGRQIHTAAVANITYAISVMDRATGKWDSHDLFYPGGNPIRNWAQYSNDFSAWLDDNVTVQVNQAANPLTGVVDVDKLVGNGSDTTRVYRTVDVGTSADIANQPWTFSVWLWTDAGQPTTASLWLYDLDFGEGSESSKNVVLTTTPQRFDIQITGDAGTTSDDLLYRIDMDGEPQGSATNGRYVYAANAQLNQGLGAKSYVESVAATQGRDLDGMEQHLRSLTAAKLIALHTHGDAKSGRLTDQGVVDQLLRCGASRSVFVGGGDSGLGDFATGSAYALIGVPGLGEGQGHEQYSGDSDNHVDSWVDIAGAVHRGAVQLAAGDSTLGALAAGLTLNEGGIDLGGPNAKFRMGSATDYLVGSGVFFGGDGKFHVGDPGAEEYLGYDGSGNVVVGRDTDIRGVDTWSDRSKSYAVRDWGMPTYFVTSVGAGGNISVGSLGALDMSLNGSSTQNKAMGVKILEPYPLSEWTTDLHTRRIKGGFNLAGMQTVGAKLRFGVIADHDPVEPLAGFWIEYEHGVGWKGYAKGYSQAVQSVNVDLGAGVNDYEVFELSASNNGSQLELTFEVRGKDPADPKASATLTYTAPFIDYFGLTILSVTLAAPITNQLNSATVGTIRTLQEPL